MKEEKQEEKQGEKYNLNKYNLSKWEIDVLTKFNTEECLHDLIDKTNRDERESFLSILADSLVSFRRGFLDSVDLRIKFYTQYAGNPGQLLKDYVGLEDVYLKKHQMYSDWLFVFCFGDMNEDFSKKIKILEEGKI